MQHCIRQSTLRSSLVNSAFIGQFCIHWLILHSLVNSAFRKKDSELIISNSSLYPNIWHLQKFIYGDVFRFSLLIILCPCSICMPGVAWRLILANCLMRKFLPAAKCTRLSKLNSVRSGVRELLLYAFPFNLAL